MTDVTTNGIDYVLGISCWHVIGYLNGDLARPKVLCGWFPDDRSIGGSSFDVGMSQMKVCGTCNRATGGSAGVHDSQWIDGQV